MTDRLYRLLLGSALVFGLYFDLNMLLVGLILLALFEGLTNLRLPLLLNLLRAPSATPVASHDHPTPARIPFDAERAWRLMVAAALTLSLVIFPPQLWWFAWFMGFAIFGAGLSGVCPGLVSLRMLGFR